MESFTNWFTQLSKFANICVNLPLLGQVPKLNSVYTLLMQGTCEIAVLGARV